MNHVYKNNPPKPKPHWYFRSRHIEKVKVRNEIFEDLEFAHYYDEEMKKIITRDVQEVIIKKIKMNF